MSNPDGAGPGGKSSSAWSMIKHGGKRLDTYKLKWFRRQKKLNNNASLMASQQASTAASSTTNSTFSDLPSMMAGLPAGALTSIPASMFKELQYSLPSTAVHDDDPEKMIIRNMINYEQLSSRHPSQEQDMSVLVKCVPFNALDRIQPFTMTMSTNALLLIDFHCHLTSGEVTGYLGGTWDTSSHNLSILQAFPCRSRLADKERSSAVEEEIRQNLETRNLSVVGWYHSHPRSAAHPSVKDIENQLEYQVIMKGETESSYTPCVGFICSPYDEYNPGPESSYQSFWVMPPNEYRPYEYGRPMQMLFSITRDSFLTQDLLLEMVRLLFVLFSFSRKTWPFNVWTLFIISRELHSLMNSVLTTWNIFQWLDMRMCLLEAIFTRHLFLTVSSAHQTSNEECSCKSHVILWQTDTDKNPSQELCFSAVMMWRIFNQIFLFHCTPS